MTGDGPTDDADDRALLSLFDAITAGDDLAVDRLLGASPELAVRSLRTGASRHGDGKYFLTAIRHHVYAGDTALHVAAAAHRRITVELLVRCGADARARNRRGAQPLHYAADGSPGADHWDPLAQAEVVTFLIGAGADPDATDTSGVAPIHRAVRTRSALAVGALLQHGATPRLTNGSGSTPLHLAVQSTGRSNAGSDESKEGQAQIIAVLLEHGARPTDIDARGRTVAAAASSDWIRPLLG